MGNDATRGALLATETAHSLFLDDHGSSLIATAKDFEYGTCINEFLFFEAKPSGLVYLSNRPVAESLNVIYPSTYEPYRFESFPGLLRRARDWVQRGKVRVVRRLAPSAADILDVGCGSGSLLRLLRAYGSPEWRLHANEMHKPSLSRLATEGFDVHAGPVQNIAGEGRFDVIILNQVLEHFADVHSLLATCHRLLKEGGHLLIETPSTSGLDFRLFRGRHWGGYHCPRHFYLFDERSLTKLLEVNGLKVCEAAYLASPAFWTQSLHHWASETMFRPLAHWLHLRNLPLTALVTLIDLLRAKLGLKTSNMRLVARKAAGVIQGVQP